MRSLVLLLLLGLSAGAVAQDVEDDAHRADRLRTQELNSRSPNGYAHTPYGSAGTSDEAEYRAAQADYRQRLADWRRRVAACEAGYYGACQQ